jgi:hypothetical protein
MLPSSVNCGQITSGHYNSWLNSQPEGVSLLDTMILAGACQTCHISQKSDLVHLPAWCDRRSMDESKPSPPGSVLPNRSSTLGFETLSSVACTGKAEPRDPRTDRPRYSGSVPGSCTPITRNNTAGGEVGVALGEDLKPTGGGCGRGRGVTHDRIIAKCGSKFQSL